MLKACIDTNIWISGIVFSGKPAEIVTAAFNRKFEVILSQFILSELKKNLLMKFDIDHKNVRKIINQIVRIADFYEPSGTVRAIPQHHPDNMILEMAALGKAKYLVTGDREHLLPLQAFKYVKIVDAAEFLGILGK